MDFKRLALACMLAGMVLPATALAQSFTILSMNVLRFGHGSRLANQCNAITAASATVDIIVLQEVMASGYPCLSANNKKGVNIAIPANFSYTSSGPKGRSSYIEYYGILYRTNKRGNTQITYLSQDDALSTTLTFMRPPFAAQFQVTDTSTTTSKSCNVWIADIHSIFGKSNSDRQAEAAAMRAVFLGLKSKNSGAVIIAGDWNLAADDAKGFGWVGTNNAAIQPNVLTSLTTAGAPSSAYDHAINTSNSVTPPSVTITQTSTGSWTYTGALTRSSWRTQVSDHMGVLADVALTC